MARSLLLAWLLLLNNCTAERGWVLATEAGEPFVFVWQVKAGEAMPLPLVKGFNYDFVIDWGDGTQAKVTSADDPNRVHTYDVGGSYAVRLSGLVEAWSTVPSVDCAITSVPDLGAVGWRSLRKAFSRCLDLFDLQGGDVSAVTDMSEMFSFADLVSADVSGWDTANVTNMNSMFSGALLVEPDVSGWDTANVTDMRFMFAFLAVADPDVSGWDTANVTSMTGMFLIAKSANPNVSKWNTANVTSMHAMFSGAKSANPDVSKWNTANVTDMNSMFAEATAANPDVSKWNTAKVTDMGRMFDGAQAAKPDLSRWDFTRVSCYADMFNGVTLPTTTYSNILIRIAATSDKRGDELCRKFVCTEWHEELPGPHGDGCVDFGVKYFPLTAGQSKYNAAASLARQELIDRGWLIEDGGQGD